MDIGTWILAGLIVVFVGFSAVTQVRASLPNLLSKPCAVPAEVVALRKIETPGSGWEPATRYVAVFRTGDGDSREFELSEDGFRTLSEGTHGTLRMRGSWFLGFNRSA